MRNRGRVSIAGVLISVALVGGLNAQTRSPQPRPAFGTSEYTVTTIPGVAFMVGNSTYCFFTSGSLSRGVCPQAPRVDFYSGLDIPAGAIIDFIGFNNLNDGTPNIMAIHLIQRDNSGVTGDLFDLDNTPHTFFATDINPAPLGILWAGSQGVGLNLILDMEIDSSASNQFFGQVEVWWKRSVSPAPATATFNDVQPGDFGFQFIEALAASGITGGCQASPPLFCPNDTLTRAQMAVFLAKALGLDWPN
jgi:hypothetical protein